MLGTESDDDDKNEASHRFPTVTAHERNGSDKEERVMNENQLRTTVTGDEERD